MVAALSSTTDSVRNAACVPSPSESSDPIGQDISSISWPLAATLCIGRSLVVAICSEEQGEAAEFYAHGIANGGQMHLNVALWDALVQEAALGVLARRADEM